MTASLQPVRDPDAELESRIKDAYEDFRRFNSYGYGAEAQRRWRIFVALRASRSPEQVERLEKQQGLR